MPEDLEHTFQVVDALFSQTGFSPIHRVRMKLLARLVAKKISDKDLEALLDAALAAHDEQVMQEMNDA